MKKGGSESMRIKGLPAITHRLVPPPMKKPKEDKRRTSRLAPTKGEQRKDLERKLTNEAGTKATPQQVIAIRRKGAAV